MKQPNPEYIEKLKRLVNQAPFFAHLSLTLSNIGIGFADFAMTVHQHHFQPFGFAHGGVIASLIDSAAFWSTHFDLDGPGKSCTSVDLKLNYLAPVASGQLLTRGKCIKMGKRLGYAEAEVRDQEGKLVSHGTSTLMVLEAGGLAGNPNLPEKYLPSECPQTTGG